MYELVPAEHRDEFYMFNTFFYPKLTSKNYEGVKNWARGELFEKKHIFVPIHSRYTD
jgi:Ulp1 family protease